MLRYVQNGKYAKIICLWDVIIIKNVARFVYLSKQWFKGIEKKLTTLWHKKL